jgi:hypothetical protein
MTAGYSQSINSPIDLRLPQTPENITDPAMYGQIAGIYNSLRQLQIGITQLTGAVQQDASSWSALLPTDSILIQNTNRLYVQATEQINAGAMVNLYSNGGAEVVARNANTAGSLQCHAFCSTGAGIAPNAYGEVIILQGLCTYVNSMTPGTVYYLSGTPGVISNAKPGSGLIQAVGIALTAGILYFCPVLQ